MPPSSQNTQMQPSAPPPPPEIAQPEKRSIGPLVATGVVLIVLILGGLYLWANKLQQDAMQQTAPFILGDEVTNPDSSAGLPPTSSSDAVTDIESDISATDLDTLEAEIDADLRAAESAL